MLGRAIFKCYGGWPCAGSKEEEVEETEMKEDVENKRKVEIKESSR